MIEQKRNKTAPQKEPILLLVFKILYEETSEEQPLTQDQIKEKLIGEYGVDATIDRRRISRAIQLLKDAGFCIEKNHRGSYFDERPLGDDEIEILLDCINNAKYIPGKFADDIAKNLLSIASPDLRNKKIVANGYHFQNQEISLNLQKIKSAIDECRAIRFKLYKYDENKTFVKTAREIEIFPEKLYMSEGQFYVGEYNDSKGALYLSYRVDKIYDLEVLDKIKKRNKTHAQFIPRYAKGGSICDVFFRIQKDEMMDEAMDFFDGKFDIVKVYNETVVIKVRMFTDDARQWAMRFGSRVEILYPEFLRKEMLGTAEWMQKIYSDKARTKVNFENIINGDQSVRQAEIDKMQIDNPDEYYYTLPENLIKWMETIPD